MSRSHSRGKRQHRHSSNPYSVGATPLSCLPPISVLCCILQSSDAHSPPPWLDSSSSSLPRHFSLSLPASPPQQQRKPQWPQRIGRWSHICQTCRSASRALIVTRRTAQTRTAGSHGSHDTIRQARPTAPAQNCLARVEERRQVVPRGPVLRQPLCRFVLPHHRGELQQGVQVQGQRIPARDPGHGGARRVQLAQCKVCRGMVRAIDP